MLSAPLNINFLPSATHNTQLTCDRQVVIVMMSPYIFFIAGKIDRIIHNFSWIINDVSTKPDFTEYRTEIQKLLIMSFNIALS